MIILLCTLCFAVGALVGWRLTWAWMQRQWKLHPYQFLAIVEEVIRLREEKAKKNEQQ